MFGLFRKNCAPDGPVAFNAEMDVGRSAEHVYRLLDWADERNAKRGEGHRVLPGDTPGQWRLVMKGAGHCPYHLSVTREVPNRHYAYVCKPERTVGKLVSSHEAFGLEPLAHDRCRVSVEVTAAFTPGLTQARFARESAAMSLACHNSLARLKIHAEQGADAARNARIMLLRGCRVEA